MQLTNDDYIFFINCIWTLFLMFFVPFATLTFKAIVQLILIYLDKPKYERNKQNEQFDN